MPPKPKFTKNEIVDAALNVVSEKGLDALTARELGDRLGSSARPIFTVFNSMDELQGEVRKAAMFRFESYVDRIIEDMPRFKQIGMQMVLFGTYEPKLYQMLFMQENKTAEKINDMYGILGKTVDVCIDAIRSDYGLDKKMAERLFENVWIYTFGVGALCATGACRFSTEQLGQMLTTEFTAMMMLIRSEK